MRLCVKIIILLAAATLLMNVVMERIYFDTQPQCACCKNKCPNENNCHQDNRDCLCAGKAPIQLALVQSGSLPTPTVSMNCLQKTDLLYSFRLSKDIFHPPKA
jgi:hypothetical protein